jgi:prepilin-type N-terminal cleavage/methylation domain-containing protein
MKFTLNRKGFSLLEVLMASAIFLLFALGIYSGINLVFKIVYQSRMRILETALLAEQLEVARNLPYDSVGIINGVPSGLLPFSTTTIRNGQTFTILTTVRNIDDAFDGTIGGNPNDSSPADYKLVEMSVICSNCSQQTPVTLSTRVAPKQLEGASQNGALFIQVFDYNGQPVVGANVTVTNTARNPSVVINDVTGNDGYLRIVDTTTGTLSYFIKVSKSGYSTDYTVPVSASVPTPVKPPSNVVSQTITDISFSIDQLSNMDLHFITPACAAVANQAFRIRGEKKIGTDASDVDIYKYDKSLTANSGGNYSFANFEWDKYHITISGTTYTIGGSTPLLPIDLTPGLTQDTSVVLQPYSANSLLVKVKDAGTGLPLSDATIHLTASGYDETRTTGYGFVRQTDWSGGSGQTSYSNQTKYFNDNGNIKNNLPAGDLKLRKVGSSYLNSGWLESSTIDLGVAANFNNIIFSPTSQPVQTGVNPITFQIATSNSSSPSSWVYTGPNGSTSTYYTATSTLIWSGNNGNRYLRYKAFLTTANTAFTPTLSEVSFTYITSCTPPGQVFFSGLSAATYTLDVSHTGYISNNDTVDVSGGTEVEVNISPS